MNGEKPHITPNWLTEVANQGPQTYGDSKLEVCTCHSDILDTDCIYLVLHPLNPYTTLARFGGCPLSSITTADCDQLTETLDRTMERMKSAARIAQSQPIEMERLDENVLFSRQNKRRYLYEPYRNEHFSIYIPSLTGEADYAISAPIILDGKQYTSIYSFWLGHSVYRFGSAMSLHEQEEHT